MAKLRLPAVPKHGLLIALVVLGLLAVLSGWQLFASIAAARLANTRWRSCQQTGEQIAELRASSALGSLGEQRPDDVLQAVRDAITSSGLPPSQVSRLDLLPAVPLGGSLVEHRSLVVELEDVQMLELVKAIRAIVAANPALSPTSIGLEALPTAEEGWIADITFTQSMLRH